MGRGELEKQNSGCTHMPRGFSWLPSTPRRHPAPCWTDRCVSVFIQLLECMRDSAWGLGGGREGRVTVRASQASQGLSTQKGRDTWC